MKIYLIDYNLDERENKKIFVSKYSSYKIGIKVNGVDNSTIELWNDNNQIASEGDFKGYNTYSFEAGTPETTNLKIYVPYSNGDVTLTLDVITTDSTVAELSSGSGGGGTPEIPTDLNLFSLYVGGEGPTNVIRAEPTLLHLKGEDFKVNANGTDVIRIDDELVDPNSWGNYTGVRVECDELNVNKKINCEYGQISYNNLTGDYFSGNSVNAYNYFSSPGFNSFNDENFQPKLEVYANNITMRNGSTGSYDGGSEIILGEYEENITGERKTGLALNNVTQMIFRDSSGSPLTVVPIQITDGNGTMYTVLGVQIGI